MSSPLQVAKWLLEVTQDTANYCLSRRTKHAYFKRETVLLFFFNQRQEDQRTLTWEATDEVAECFAEDFHPTTPALIQ